MSRTGVQTMMDTQRPKRKKGEDDDEAARIAEELRSFEDEFNESPDVIKPKTFIRMGIVNANKADESVATKPTVYKPTLPNPLQEMARKANTSGSAKSTFEEAKRMAAEKARKMMEEAHKGKAGPVPTVVAPSTAAPLNRPPKPGTNRAKEIQKSKTSNLDAFKEELKRMQAERDTRKNVREHLKNELGVDQAQIDLVAPPIANPYHNVGTGSAELDDNTTTTNLYIGNLPLTVQMEDLLETFGTYGPLASGKILFPRGDEERKREYLCGFVAYMSRKDFDRAMKGLQGLMIQGDTVKISFARAVTIPPVPFYVPPDLEKLAVPDPPTNLPFNAMPRQSEVTEYLEKYKQLPEIGTLPEEEEEREAYKKMIKNATVRVVIPTDSALLAVIHRTVEFVIREGPLFEAMLMSREGNNPLFRFLFDNHHPAHVYYRWRLYATLQGDRQHLWRRDRFRMFDEGSWWQPPLVPTELFKSMPESLYFSAFNVQEQKVKLGLVDPRDARREDGGGRRRRSHSRSPDKRGERGRRREKKSYLSSKDRDKLEDIVRDVIPEKDQIGSAMVWCIEHAQWAQEVAECLYESLTIDETPLHKKVARLYLIADILANAAVRGVKDVFYFRQHFETLFPKVFNALGKTLRAIDGRLKAEQFKQRVMGCFRAWEDNTIYPNEMLIHCQNIFLGLIEHKETEGESVSGDVEGDDYDGVPVDDELDGVPLSSQAMLTGNNWNSVQSASSSVAMDGEEVDGIPLDDDGGSAHSSSFSSATLHSATSTAAAAPFSMKKPAFKPMQWASVEPSAKKSKWDEEEEEEVKKAGKRPLQTLSPPSRDENDERAHAANQSIFPESDSDGDVGPSVSATSTTLLDDEKRKLMREIEVKVMALQDELEGDGERDVKKKVDKFREGLIKRMEEKLEKKKDKKEKKEKKSDKGGKEKEEKKRSRSRERKRSRSRSRERRRERSKSREKDSRRDRDRERRRSRSRDRRR